MSTDEVAKAEAEAHPFLATQDPNALSNSLLPILTKDWPAACLDMAKAAEDAPKRPPDANALVSGMQLPLLRHDEVVQCSICKRMLLREALDKHKARGPHHTLCRTPSPPHPRPHHTMALDDAVT